MDQYILNYKPENYAVDVKLQMNSSGYLWEKDICKFLVYGQNTSQEERYLLGNAFLSGYYVMLDYNNQSLGFNGQYWKVNKTQPFKPLPPVDQPSGPKTIVIIAIIAGALLFVAVGACIFIKKRNERLQAELSN
jgi:hypothetical protein